MAGQSREFELNEYVNLVGRRDSAGALAVLERLQDWGEEPVKITAWLATAFGLRRVLGIPSLVYALVSLAFIRILERRRALRLSAAA